MYIRTCEEVDHGAIADEQGASYRQLDQAAATPSVIMADSRQLEQLSNQQMGNMCRSVLLRELCSIKFPPHQEE